MIQVDVSGAEAVLDQSYSITALNFFISFCMWWAIHFACMWCPLPSIIAQH